MKQESKMAKAAFNIGLTGLCIQGLWLLISIISYDFVANFVIDSYTSLHETIFRFLFFILPPALAVITLICAISAIIIMKKHKLEGAKKVKWALAFFVLTPILWIITQLVFWGQIMAEPW